MAIESPINSFVNFNDELLTCEGLSRQAPLPVYDNFGIKFQFYISDDELLPPDTIFKAAICSEDCELLYNPDYEVIPACNRFALTYDNGATLVTNDHFPITIGEYAPEPGQPQVPAGTYTKAEFLEAINQAYGIFLQSFDFVGCCPQDFVISGIIAQLTGEETVESLELSTFYNTGWVHFPADSMTGIINDMECFRYCILNEANEVLKCSNKFTRITDDCKTTVFEYYNRENGFGFKYVPVTEGANTVITANRIRLFVHFIRPEQANLQENLVRKPNGTYERTNTFYDWQYIGESAPLSAEQHRQLGAMLKHDVVHATDIEAGIDWPITSLGTIDIIYPDRIRKPLNPATFNIIDQRDNNTNSNCGGECGVEFVDDCEGGGGIVQPCPDKFYDELVVGNGSGIYPMADGQLIYTAPELDGATGVQVFREGVFQYQTGPGYHITYVPGSQNITFDPAVQAGERIAIWEE